MDLDGSLPTSHHLRKMTTTTIIPAFQPSATSAKKAPMDANAIDQDLVRRTVDGDMGAFRELYDRHLRRVTAQVGRIMGPWNDVEDTVQEVFVQLHRALPSYRHDSRFTTWLYRIAWNVTVSYIRQQSRQRHRDSLADIRLSDDDWGRLDARSQMKVLYAALEEVSEAGRQAFVLHEVEGRPLREVAELTEVSINTAAARVRRTRERLKEILVAATMEPQHD